MTNIHSTPFELIGSHISANQKEIGKRQEQLASRSMPRFRNHLRSASLYRPSQELLLTVNMALHTGSPLLLTGEPGTGKTQAADFIGQYFGINVYKFFVKSTSVAQDIIYEFDAVGYLHWAQSANVKPHQSDISDLLNTKILPQADSVREKFLQPRALWQAYNDPLDSVVLIDEIDKAPRDFPNDLLHEFDQHHFRHPFDTEKMIYPLCSRPPIIIITSNDERRLPDPFLRRCIFHRIELTKEIVESAVASMSDSQGKQFPHLNEDVLNAAQRRFWELRQLQPPLEKKPSTAELIIWLSILSAKRVSAKSIENATLSKLEGVEALIKDTKDIDRLRNLRRR